MNKILSHRAFETTHKSPMNHNNNNNQNSFKGGSSKTTIAILTICSCCVSFICTFITIVAFVASSALSSILEKTEGQIIGQEDCNNGNSGNNEYAAIIEYYDEFNRETYKFVSEHCSNSQPEVGNDIEVFYNPEAPGEAYDNVFLSLWFGPLFVSVLTIAFWVCFCILACIYHKRFSGPSEPSNNIIEHATPSPSAPVYNGNVELPPNYTNNTIEQSNPPESVPIYTAYVVETTQFPATTTTTTQTLSTNTTVDQMNSKV